MSTQTWEARRIHIKCSVMDTVEEGLEAQVTENVTEDSPVVQTENQAIAALESTTDLFKALAAHQFTELKEVRG